MATAQRGRLPPRAIYELRMQPGSGKKFEGRGAQAFDEGGSIIAEIIAGPFVSDHALKNIDAELVVHDEAFAGVEIDLPFKIDTKTLGVAERDANMLCDLAEQTNAWQFLSDGADEVADILNAIADALWPTKKNPHPPRLLALITTSTARNGFTYKNIIDLRLVARGEEGEANEA